MTIRRNIEQFAALAPAAGHMSSRTASRPSETTSPHQALAGVPKTQADRVLAEYRRIGGVGAWDERRRLLMVDAMFCEEDRLESRAAGAGAPRARSAALVAALHAARLRVEAEVGLAEEPAQTPLVGRLDPQIHRAASKAAA